MIDCIFCKIVAGNIPNYTVYEDQAVLAFLDVFPHAKGHTVIVPKKHIEKLENLSDNDWQNLSLGLKRSWDKINQILKPDGCNIGINDQSAGGQVVPHVHWHILPRYHDDGGGSVHSIVKNSGNLTPAEVAVLFK